MFNKATSNFLKITIMLNDKMMNLQANILYYITMCRIFLLLSLMSITRSTMKYIHSILYLSAIWSTIFFSFSLCFIHLLHCFLKGIHVLFSALHVSVGYFTLQIKILQTKHRMSSHNMMHCYRLNCPTVYKAVNLFHLNLLQH